MDNQWQLQEAKSQFSHLVEQACNHGPQFVTKHGNNAVVILSYEEYQSMIKPAGNLTDFLKESPFSDEPDEEQDFSRSKDFPRDTEL